MSAELRSVQIDAGELVFNGELTVGQVRKMSSSDGDIDAVIEVLSGIVHSWPFDGDANDEEAWDALTMSQFNQVATAITSELGKGLS